MVLTLIAGVIPSRIASKKDPVEALRSEQTKKRPPRHTSVEQFYYDSLEDIKSRIKTEKRVLPTKDTAWINKHVDLWRKAVTRSLSWK